MLKYVDVILPLAAPGTFTYLLPDALQQHIKVGVRVVVQLGSRKLYTGIAARIHSQAPQEYAVKEIQGLLDKEPVVLESQLQFWEWLSRYYLCSIGAVMQAAMPAGLKLQSEMKILKNHAAEYEEEELNDAEFLVMEAFETQESLSIKELSDITGLKNPLICVYQLMGKRCVLLEEELKGGYKPTQKRYAKLAEAWQGAKLEAAFTHLNKAPRQKEILMAYLQMSREGEEVLAARLLKMVGGSAQSSLNSLHEKGILDLYHRSADDLPAQPSENERALPVLSAAQKTAYQSIKTGWQEGKTALLHGVTSSGKTEIYITLMAEVLQQGKQVLYLLPEIALTTQLIQRLRRYFGNKVVVYHSRFSSKQRAESWLQLCRSEEPLVVLGARSALLLPLRQMGLVVVDEEHDSSYKQKAPAPRYQARDAALKSALQSGAKVVLGSATPSYESYRNARLGKYHLVRLTERFGSLPMPELATVDLKEEQRYKRMHGHFSAELIDALGECLKQKRQAILFQNRRGFSTLLQCHECGEVVQCKNCDISLTYHKFQNVLKCHYCGYVRKVPPRCPTCKSNELRSLGFGTEKLEDDLQILLPEARIQRMDLDTTRRKNAFENIIREFEEGQTDILIGTQMVTKGLDFENVALVGIINADTLIHFPDFRSHERAFQLITQVAGRAGRKGRPGKVLIQTSQPNHWVIEKALQYNFTELYQVEMQERKNFAYPPLVRVIQIVLRHRDKQNLMVKAEHLGNKLRAAFGGRLLGPEFPLTPRLKNRYYMEFLLKIEPDVSVAKVKQHLLQLQEKFEIEFPKKKVDIIYDVDP